MIHYIIPCGAEKTTAAAPARNLYIGASFRNQLAAVEALAAHDRADGETVQILIMSALHGLVTLDTVLEPYDLKLTRRTGITVDALAATAEQAGIAWGDEVYSFLPAGQKSPYFARLAAALDTLDVWPQDVYEAAPGIGYQRGVIATVNRSLAA